LGLSTDQFYDSEKVAIIPMGFCFPGTGKGGDLPPRAECAVKWRAMILGALQSVELTVIIGRYSMDWHLPHLKKQSVTQVVKNWRDYWPEKIVLPHPSPRNNRWLKSNPWFDADVLPELRSRIETALQHR
jgi:uracil-DNA glycosylase